MFIFNSKFHDHKVTLGGDVIAEFDPTPERNPKTGVVPTHGVFVTEDRELAKVLKELGTKQGITLAAGSEDPDAAPAAKTPAPSGEGAPAGEQGKDKDPGKK